MYQFQGGEQSENTPQASDILGGLRVERVRWLQVSGTFRPSFAYLCLSRFVDFGEFGGLRRNPGDARP